MQPGVGIYKSKHQTWTMKVTYKRKTQAYYRICPFSEHFKSVIFKVHVSGPRDGAMQCNLKNRTVLKRWSTSYYGDWG
jgi:hypothetical protein